MVIDCHTPALHSRKWGWALVIHRYLMRRARAVMVHTEEEEVEVRGWTSRVVLVPDDLPVAEQVVPAEAPGRGFRVLVAGSLDSGEPVAAALAAARHLDGVEVRLTGDPERVAAATRAAAPANASFTGWLEYPRFLAELLAADVVAAFSSDPGIMNRAAFEAVALGKPVVLSDMPGLRRRFSAAALFTPNDPAAMADTLRRAIEQRSELAQRSQLLQAELRHDRERALARLKVLIEPTPKKRVKRVLVVSQHPYAEAPLLQRNVEHLVNGGIRVDLVCMRSGSPSIKAQPPAGVRLIALPVRHERGRRLNYVIEYLAFFALALPIASVLAIRHRYDTVEIDNLPDFLAYVGIVARLRGARLVLYIYDLFPELTMTRLRVPAKHWTVRLARVLEMASIRWVDHVITVSECFRRRLIGRGADPSKVTVVYNTQPVTIRQRVSPNGATTLVTHATLVERYGVQVAIRALPHLRDRWPTLRYEILGRGEYESTLRRLATDLGVADLVSFPGYLPWRQAMDRITHAAVGIVPVIADGFGELILPMKLLEYVGLGIPAVCARLPGIEEHFPEDALAYFTPGREDELARQVDRLLRDPLGARAQAERARQALQSIRWEIVSPRYLAALGTA
jgi:glycosyltransferase involved in cell wall biosynthesis